MPETIKPGTIKIFNGVKYRYLGKDKGWAEVLFAKNNRNKLKVKKA